MDGGATQKGNMLPWTKSHLLEGEAQEDRCMGPTWRKGSLRINKGGIHHFGAF